MIKPFLPLSPERRAYPLSEDHLWREAETFEGDFFVGLEGTFETVSSSLLYGGTGQFYRAFADGFYADRLIRAPLLQAQTLTLFQSPFADTSLTLTLSVKNLTASSFYQMPPQDGAQGQVLSTDGKGTLSWSDGGAAKLLDAPYILQQPHDELSKAQALNQLTGDFPRILKANEEGVIDVAAPNTDYLTPSLPSGNLFIGNSNNIATPQPIIALSNLPNLGVAIIQGLDLPAGRIWRGTASNRPEESDALSEAIADLLLLNARFLTGSFIMGNALVQYTYPNAQYLTNLADGLLKHTGATLQQAVSGTDYVDATGAPIAQRIPLWSQNNQKVLANSNTQLLDNGAGLDDVRGINSLKAVLLQATNAVTSDADMISRNTVQTTELILFDRDPAHRQNIGVSLKGPASIPQNIKWVMPEAISATGQVLTDMGAVPLSTDRQLGFRNILPDNLQDTLLSQGRDGQNNPIFVNATLSQGKVWQGDENNKPVEVQLEVAPTNALYILKQPNDTLPNAQALNQLVGADPKMLKAAADGTIEVAVPDQDYATKATLEQLKEEAQQAAQEAATSAEEAATSATEASASAGEATTAAGEATAAAGEATGAATAASGSAAAALGSAGAAALSALAASGSASSASSSASDASSSASKASDSATAAGQSAQDAAASLHTLLTTPISLIGDVQGSGLLTAPITTKFKDNPTLPGTQYVIIPAGNNNDKPDGTTSSIIPGMLRLNTGT